MNNSENNAQMKNLFKEAENVRNLENEINTTLNEAEKLQVANVAARDQVDQISDQLASLSSKAEKISEQTSETVEKLSKISEKLDAVAKDIASFQSSKEEITKSISALQEKINNYLPTNDKTKSSKKNVDEHNSR